MVPFRPRNIGTKEDEEAGFVSETEEEYQAAKDEALGESGYGAMVQMQIGAGQEANLAPSLINRRRGEGGMSVSQPTSKAGALRRVIQPLNKF